MVQKFYLIGHRIVGDDFVIDKVFLQDKKAITWGKRLATSNPEYTVELYSQEITTNGKIKYEKDLLPFK